MNFILGAGFTGMAASIKTKFPIYEATAHPGGICRSYKMEGFEFSTGGGHWIFGEGKGLDYIKSQVEINAYERRASVYYNKFFPYPIQTTAQKACMAHPGTLKHWLIQTFGPEQFNLFFGPFNEKYTSGLYETVTQTDQYKSPPPGGKGFCPMFYDPKGGLDALVNKMSSQCDIHYNSPVVGISPENKSICVMQGEKPKTIEYQKLISTIPLNSLLLMCGRKTDLPYTSALVINIGADPGKLCPTDHWVYVPFCKSNFYRVGFYSNIDQSKAPEGKVSLSVEMSFFPKNRPEQEHLEEICFDIIHELQEWGWIGEVKVVDPTWVENAYTWLYHKDDAIREIEWLKSKGIISTGRYGKWKFQGMQESIADGLSI